MSGERNFIGQGEGVTKVKQTDKRRSRGGYREEFDSSEVGFLIDKKVSRLRRF